MADIFKQLEYGINTGTLPWEDFVVSILHRPIIEQNKVKQRGLMILTLPTLGCTGWDMKPFSYDAALLEVILNLQEHYVLAERVGGSRNTRNNLVDIKMLERPDYIPSDYKGVTLNISDADFVNLEYFCPMVPLEKSKNLSGLSLGFWGEVKQHKQLIKFFNNFPQVNLTVGGHFLDGNLKYYEECKKLITETTNIKLLYTREDFLVNFIYSTPYYVNNIINCHNFGILASTNEGHNRFKMECLAADKPVLIRKDANTALQKHINAHTGLLYTPTIEGIREALETLKVKSFNCRAYLKENNIGVEASNERLKNAYIRIVEKETGAYIEKDYNLYRGRNENMVWGTEALKHLKEVLC